MFSSSTVLLALFSLTHLVITSPLSTPNTDVDIFKHQSTPCSPGGQPILYKDYYNQPAGLCGPPKNALGLDGDNIICPGNQDDNCYTFCEVYQYFQYDVEQPVLANPYCHGPMTCTISDSQAFTYKYTGTFNVGIRPDLAKVLSAGMTGGLSLADAKTQLVAKEVTLKQGECGYMTFLPELHYSCGTTSEGIWGNKQCNVYTTNTNVCSASPFRSADGKKVIGSSVFVWTDCATNARLPMDQQDPAYQHHGVALPQSAFISTFRTCNCNEDGCSDQSPPCCDNGSCPAGSAVVGGGEPTRKRKM